MPMRRASAILAATALCVLGVPAAAQASLQWSTDPQPISATQSNAAVPAVGFDGEGNGIAVWRQDESPVSRIRVEFRPKNNYFTISNPPLYLSTPGVNAYDPHIAVAADGTAVAVWIEAQPTGTRRYDVMASERPAGGQFGAPTNLTPEAESAQLPTVNLEPNGDALITWVRANDTLDNDRPAPRLQFSSHVKGQPFGGSANLYTSPTPPANGSIQPIIDRASVAIDAQGNALVAWGANDNSFNQDRDLAAIHARQRPLGSYFRPDTVVATRGSQRAISSPRTALSNGNQWVAWSIEGFAGPRGTAQASYRAVNTGTWSTPQDLAGPLADGNDAGVASLTTDPSGNVLAVLGVTTNYVSSVKTAFAPAGSGTFEAPAPFATSATDAQVRGVGTDATGNVTAVYTLPDGHIYAVTRTPGEAGTYDTPHDLGTPGANLVLGVAPPGNAILLWTTSNGENDILQAYFGELPPAPGEPAPPPLPPPPPPPAPPVPSAIQTARPFAAGKAAVLTVAVSGDVTRLEWTLGSNESPIVAGVVDGKLQNSIRLRLHSGKISVKAIGPGGATTFSRSFSTPGEPNDANAKKVRDGIKASAPRVVAVGDADALTGKSACGPVTVYASNETLSGCFRPADTLADIPSAERGVLQPLASALKLTQSDAPLMSRAVELTDGYVATGRVIVNGVWPVEPAGAAKVVGFPQAEALVSSNAAFRVADRLLKPSGGFNLHLNPSSPDIPLGTLSPLAGFQNIGDFPTVGGWTITLNSGGNAIIDTTLRLPSFISRNGVPVQTPLRMYATPTTLNVGGVSIGPTNVNFGIIPVNGFKLSYDQGANRWTGQGTACIFNTGACLDMAPPGGGIEITGGQLTRAAVSHDYGSPGKPLVPGVFLENIGVGFGLDPSRLFGSARIGIGPFIKVDGRMVYAFPSTASPYFLRRDEVGDAFPPDYYKTPITRPMIAAGADEYLTLPVIGDTKLANGYLLYELPGFIAFGGGASLNVLGVIRYSGNINGQYDVVKQQYNLHGDINACLIAVDDDLCAGSVANMSRGPNLEGGAGGCLNLGPVSVGGGVQWARKKPFIWPLDGCKWSRFKIDIKPSRVVAAQAGGGSSGYTVDVKKGDASKAIQVDGSGGAPALRVTGPSGTLDSTDKGLDYTADGSIRIMRTKNSDEPFSVVGLQNPKPGTYTIEALPGSAPIAGVSEASDPKNARVSGKVTGKGPKRVLQYNVMARPDQKVTFYDTAPNGNSKPIKTISGGGRGKITFTPAPGKTLRKIVAKFELNGMAAEERTVTSFRPPSPVLPPAKGLRVRRAKGSALAISWRGVSGARTYEVAITASTGMQVFRTTKARGLVVKGIKTSVAGTVTVRAVAD
ncbi:MAG: hypothetical protein QOJ07_2875, partial [Thermoleophilaceae bacterium]|nr:hypothetical protein [Thermoleophilaceae bacterium]